MNLITLKAFETSQIESIIDTSIQIKQDPLKYGEVLKNKKMYMLFEKTSTRHLDMFFNLLCKCALLVVMSLRMWNKYNCPRTVNIIMNNYKI